MAAIPDRTPFPDRTPMPSPSYQVVVKYVLTEYPYWEWLVAGIAISALIIIGVIVAVAVLLCKKKKEQVYAEEDSPSEGNYAGTAVVLNVYNINGKE